MAEWDTTLFDCFADCKVLAVTCCCTPCQGAYQYATVQDRDCSIVDLLYFFFCGPCFFIYTRGLIREKFNLSGSCMMDVISLCCCSLCAISQQTRQLEIKGRRPAGMFMDPGEALLG